VLRRGIGLAPLVHGLPLLAYLLLRGLVAGAASGSEPPGPGWQAARLAALLNEFTPWLFLPLPLWLLSLAIARTKAAVFATALPWVMFLALYGELFVPRPATLAEWSGRSAPGETRLRVMTFNVWASARPADGLARVVADAQPDVLLAQELVPELATGLDAAVGDAYPYSRLRTDGLWEAQGVWSRYPIVQEERWGGSTRAANWQHVVLDVHGRRVHVVSLHLSQPLLSYRGGPLPVRVAGGEASGGRSQEVAWLVPRLQALAAGPDPLLVAGDFNSTDQTPEFSRLLGAGLSDAYRQAGWGIDLTYPADLRPPGAGRGPAIAFPFLGIDHVLVSPLVQARRAQVWPDSGSSRHHPVVVEVVVPPAAARGA
jgi:endonuclease/exonuclease/phosphatase (EEP) superfamily protein YafD